MKFKCLIVEDELPAQRVLQRYIKDVPPLELVESCNNALDALEVLKNEHIDILFLDIQLPKMTGINFLKTLAEPPQTIFTTAYSEYAMRTGVGELSFVDGNDGCDRKDEDSRRTRGSF